MKDCKAVYNLLARRLYDARMRMIEALNYVPVGYIRDDCLQIVKKIEYDLMALGFDGETISQKTIDKSGE